MSKRRLKIAALVLSGGVLLQLGGCAALIAEQILSTIASGILTTLIRNILGTAANTT